MSEIFLTVVNMSISASWVVLAVLLLRLCLKKAPKWIAVLLWGVAAIRLICPFSVESVLSLLPSAETVSPQIMTAQIPQINSGIYAINSAVNPILGESFAPTPEASADPLQIWIPIVAAVWGAGVVLLLVYAAVSALRLRSKIGAAVLLRGKIYRCETVASPFVFGIFKPKIYLPYSMSEQNAESVIAHEEAHIRRKDHLWKPIAFLLLALHWFNPLMWLGYALLCRDIELACDEKVIKDLSREQRADYSQVLLSCSVNRRLIAACPLAFGEVGVRQRIKNVLSYRKPAFWLIAVGILALIVTAVCLLTNPQGKSLKNLESADLTPYSENTVSIWAGNGESYRGTEKFDREALNALLELRISGNPVSLDRDENRDRSHTLVLQKTGDNEPLWESRLKGLFICFNRDFTEVWLDVDVKPTLSYRIADPEAAEKLYGALRADCGYSDAAIKPSGSESQPIHDFVLPPRLSGTQSLRERFPMYFDLPTAKGLEVYAWQMAPGSYSFGLLPGRNLSYGREELWNLSQAPATVEEMRAIVASYMPAVARSGVTVIPITMPHSSYAYSIDKEYSTKLTEYFWSNFPSVPNAQYSPIIDTAVFDIDGDGKSETCFLRYGRTSGLFTFSFHIAENGITEYFNTFNSDAYELSFVESGSVLKVKAVTYGDDPKESLFDISLDSANISLTCDGQPIGSYWGKQGADALAFSGN